MGTASFDIAKYGKLKGSAAATVIGELVTSGAHTTTTSASSLTDGAAGGGSAVAAIKGHVLHIEIDELARVAFGGVTATAAIGHLLSVTSARDIEIPADGAISIIDVA